MMELTRKQIEEISSCMTHNIKWTCTTNVDTDEMASIGYTIKEEEEEKLCKTCKFFPFYNEAYTTCGDIIGECNSYEKWQPRRK